VVFHDQDEDFSQLHVWGTPSESDLWRRRSPVLGTTNHSAGGFAVVSAPFRLSTRRHDRQHVFFLRAGGAATAAAAARRWHWESNAVLGHGAGKWVYLLPSSSPQTLSCSSFFSSFLHLLLALVRRLRSSFFGKKKQEFFQQV